MIDLTRSIESPILCPSLLSADFSDLQKDLREIEEESDWLHLDVMDGHFVPNITFGPGVVKAIRPYWKKPFDVHLMVSQPDLWFKPFAEAGSDLLVFHIEAVQHPHRSIQTIHQLGCAAGIALNPGTPICLVEPLIPFLDLILVMSVNPGFGGQAYIPEMEKKIRQLKTLIDESGRSIVLEVDGGVSLDTIENVARAGANAFVSGSAVFKSADRKATLREMRSKVKSLSNQFF